MNDNFIKVKTENGTYIILEILDMADDISNNKTYILYKLINNEDIFISRLSEKENSFSIETIDDKDEFDAIEQFFINKLEENSGEMSLW